jgi:hypothetical protein
MWNAPQRVISVFKLLLVCMVQGAAKVSLLMIGQQAIMDAYLCLLHLTAGILVGMNSRLSLNICKCNIEDSTHIYFISFRASR